MNAKLGLIGVFWTMVTVWLAVGTTLLANGLGPTQVTESGEVSLHAAFIVPYAMGWAAWVVGLVAGLIYSFE